MDPDAPHALLYARPDFEEPGADGLHRGALQDGVAELRAEDAQEIVGEGKLDEPKGVGHEAMTGEAVGAQGVLQLVNEAFRRAPVAVEAPQVHRQPLHVAHKEAAVGPFRVDLDLVDDAPFAAPGAGLVPEAGHVAARLARPFESSAELLKVPVGMGPEGLVGGYADQVAEPVSLAELVEPRHRRPRIGPHG